VQKDGDVLLGVAGDRAPGVGQAPVTSLCTLVMAAAISGLCRSVAFPVGTVNW
jgi:hypothetical protein